MAQNMNVDLVVAALDVMAQNLENKGNLELASLVDEVTADLMVEAAAPKALKAEKPKAPKPAKGNNKRRKKQKKKTANVGSVMSRSKMKRVLKAAYAELLDIAGELLKDKDVKNATAILRYAEEVKAEEEGLEDGDMPLQDDDDEGAADGNLFPAEDGDEGLHGDDGEEGDDLDEGDDEGDLDGDDDISLDDGADEGDLGAGDLGGDMDDDDDDLDKEVEAMLRKYDLDKKDEPAAPPAAPEAPEPPKAPGKDDKKDDDKSDDNKDEDKSDDKKDDDKKDGDDKTDDEKVAGALFDLAKKLASAGETKLAYDIADLLDRQSKK